MGIAELAGIVRRGLGADQAAAEALVGACRLRGAKPDFYGAGGPAAAALWQRFTERRVLAEVAGKQQLLDTVLGWPHDRHSDDDWYSCSQARDAAGEYVCTNESREGEPCDCGRDARVLAILNHLAQPYQETT